MELSENEKEAIKRCEYACQLLIENNISHQIKKKEIGHINLLYKGKAVMSFWARTGKYIFLRTPKKIINFGDNRGIKNCIKTYKRYVELEEEASRC